MLNTHGSVDVKSHIDCAVFLVCYLEKKVVHPTGIVFMI